MDSEEERSITGAEQRINPTVLIQDQRVTTLNIGASLYIINIIILLCVKADYWAFKRPLYNDVVRKRG